MKKKNIPRNMFMPEYFWGGVKQLHASFEHYLIVMSLPLKGSIDPLGGTRMSFT